MTNPQEGIQIPPDQLSPEALQAVIEEFVTRDGTDPYDASAKADQVRKLLERGEVEIWFDPALGSCSLQRVAT